MKLDEEFQAAFINFLKNNAHLNVSIHDSSYTSGVDATVEVSLYINGEEVLKSSDTLCGLQKNSYDDY